ncbi:FeoB-associated Cys-rich membrane protein [Oscillospiraceae bacterium PP1C4]
MGLGDFIIIGVIAVLLFFAIRYSVRHKGGCGGCSGCSGCPKAGNCDKKKPEP